MAIFAVIHQPSALKKELDAEIASKFPDAFKLDGDAGYLVRAPVDAQSLSAQLGISEGRTGSALVVEVASYFGRGNPNTWTWLRENMA